VLPGHGNLDLVEETRDPSVPALPPTQHELPYAENERLRGR
jgi:hypothetical protein